MVATPALSEQRQSGKMRDVARIYARARRPRPTCCGTIEPAMKPESKAQFLTWIAHRRTRAICRDMGLELVEHTTSRRGIARYIELGWRSSVHLLRSRPELLLVQTPSVVLGALVLMLRPWVGYRLVFDAHNEAVEPYLNTSPFMKWLGEFLIRKADAVVVTNSRLAIKVDELAGTPAVLHDPIPEPPLVEVRRPAGDFVVVIISTFASDEPLSQVFDGATRVGESYQFYVTGNPRKLDPELGARRPPNVTLTGFLEEAAYWQLLKSADIVMDLTLMPDCLVCGAYEAIAVGTPLVLSEGEAARELFAGAAVFVRNDPVAIADGLLAARSDIGKLRQGAEETKPRLDRLWQLRAAGFKSLFTN